MNKYVLLTGTAVAFCVMDAPAKAQIEARVGGYFDAYYAAGSQDDGPGQPGFNRRSHGLFREAEIWFIGNVKLDSGLTVGVDVQLEAEDCTDQIDESYIYFDTAYGRLLVGSENSGPNLIAIDAPTVLSGFGSNEVVFFLANTGGNDLDPRTRIGQISGDAEKLTYISPRIEGLRFAASYTPENCEEGNTGVGATRCGGSTAGMKSDIDAGQQSEIAEIGADYTRKFGDFQVGLFGGYALASLEAPSASQTDDREEYGFGARLGYGSLMFSGAWRHDNQGLAASGNDRTDWSFGVSYGFGNWQLSALYVTTEAEQGAGLGADELDIYEAGARYQLGPGIWLMGGLIHYEASDNLGNPADENDATFAVVGTRVAF